MLELQLPTDEDNFASDSSPRATLTMVKAYVNPIAIQDALSELSGDSDDA